MIEPLMGREPHMRLLRSALDGLRTGAGAAVALVGEPGIGKSELLYAAAGDARAGRIAVIAVRCADLIQSSDMSAACTAVVDSVTEYADAGLPVLVTVDDVHLLGADDAGLVGRLLSSTETGPVLCVLTYRRRQLEAGSAASLAASAGMLRVTTLDPLTREQAAGLLDGRADADEVYRESGGNPRYIKALCSLRDFGSSMEAGAAVCGELGGLGDEALAAVQAAAVLGEPSPVALLAEVAGLDDPAALRALDLLARVDLVRPAERGPHLALRHRVVGEAVYERLAPSLRCVLHRRAADALARAGAPVAEHARHVARAADPSRPEHLTTLIAAARAALYPSPTVAADYLQAALPLLRDGDEHAHEAHVLLARARLLSGELTEGRALLDALRSAAPDGATGGAALDSSRIERRLGRLREAGALARSGLAALAETDSATAAALHIELSDNAYDMQDHQASRVHAETAAALAARYGDRVGEAYGLAQSAVGYLYTDDEVTAAARTTAAAELIDAAPDGVLLTNLEAALQLGLAEGWLGRLADSERHLSRAEALGRGTGQTYLDGSLLTVLSNVRLRLGKLDSALTVLERCARRIEEFGSPMEDAASAAVRAAVLHWRDEPGDAAQSLAAAQRSFAIASDSAATWAVHTRCFHAEQVLLHGDPARARSLLLEAGGDDLAAISPWRRPRWLDTLAEAAFAEGDSAAAEHWAALAERIPQRLPSMQAFVLRSGVWAHGARGEYEDALTLAQVAVRAFAAGGERIEVGRTLLAAVSLALEAGRSHGVADWLDRVATLAEQCGSARLMRQADGHRARLTAVADVQNNASTPLTPREREIADLVSTGMTNTAIAAKLFMSVRTVETHLRQIYRKLDVPNRATLTRLLLDSQYWSKTRSGL